MCNARFQPFYADAQLSASDSQSLYASVDLVQQSSRPHSDALSMSPHDPNVPSLSPVSASGWSYPMNPQSDVSIYSPASSASYSSFASPVETNTRAYALAGALQQPSATTGYPESSQRSTDLARGAAHAPLFEAQQVAPRWPYTSHAFPHEELSMPRAPIPQGIASPSDVSTALRDASPRIQAGFGSGNVSAIELPSDAPVGDRQPREAVRHMHAGVPMGRGYPLLQPHRAMASHQHWLMSSQSPSQAQQQQQQGLAGGVPFLQTPTPRAAQAPQPQTPIAYQLRDPFPFNPSSLSSVVGDGCGAEFDCEVESDEYGDPEEFDEALDEEEHTEYGDIQMHIPTASPTPELQFPQGLSGTPADLLRTNLALYSGGSAGWSAEGLGALVGARAGPLVDSAHVQSHPHSPSRAQGKARVTVSITPPDVLRAPEKKDKGKRAQAAGADESEGQTVKVLIESGTPGEPPKKVKMHQCRICQKLFPRPSGLATHMNSHSGARPFKCPLALCPKTFAVRSNARRHLRTHGITAPPSSLGKNGSGRAQEEPFHVGFDTPVVVDVHDPGSGASSNGVGTGPGGKTPKLRWVPPSLATRTNAPRLRSLSPASDMADVDADGDSEAQAYADFRSADGRSVRQSVGAAEAEAAAAPLPPLYARRAPGLKIAPTPLPPAVPSESVGDVNARFDERNSYAEAGTYPYHPNQKVTDFKFFVAGE